MLVWYAMQSCVLANDLLDVSQCSLLRYRIVLLERLCGYVSYLLIACKAISFWGIVLGTKLGRVLRVL
jgi:hypothetical protein